METHTPMIITFVLQWYIYCKIIKILVLIVVVDPLYVNIYTCC